MTPVPLRSRRIAWMVYNGPPEAAFSLLEMMTVLALLLISASFALPACQNIVLRTREAALRDDLYTLRSLIDRFTLDNRRAPASLEEAGSAEVGAVGLPPRFSKGIEL
jgi:prepilin-type N-terminal cleavage/methylation domain-containing protein